MGYVGKLFKEPKFWVKGVGLPALVALNLADFLSAILASPGFFEFWVIRLTIVGLLMAGIVAAIRHTLTQKREKESLLAQKLYEARRIQELTAYVNRFPEFQTPCYSCRHFNVSNKGCMREIHNLKARRMCLGTRFYYCLYWEPRKGDG